MTNITSDEIKQFSRYIRKISGITVDKNSWRIKDELRLITAFKRLNLMEPIRGLDTFDIVFFRNKTSYTVEEFKNGYGYHDKGPGGR